MAEATRKAGRKSAGVRTARAKPAPAATSAAQPRRDSHPRRTRKTLGDDFAAALRADFRAHGAGVIAAVRAEKPDQYLKVVLTMLPRDFAQGLDADKNTLERLSDDEIRSRIRGLEATVRPLLEGDGDLPGPT
jgi:hypothetical protein